MTGVGAGVGVVDDAEEDVDEEQEGDEERTDDDEEDEHDDDGNERSSISLKRLNKSDGSSSRFNTPPGSRS